MKRNKDISDLIRENQHKLNERPSPRNWQRLESKLDNQRNRHRTSVYKQFAMVAAVVALVAVASLISITVNSPMSSDKTMMAEADYAPMSQPVHELETVYTDANEDLHKVVEFQRSLKRIYASNPNPIAEGNQNKKVVAANEDAKKNNASTSTPTIERTTEKIISTQYLGTWKYDKNLNRNKKINIIQSGNTIQLLIKTEGTKDAIYDFVSEKNNIITFVNTSSKEGYNIRIENGKYVIYKNNQDYGLLIEKGK